MNQREEQMLPLLFQERGGRATDDLAIRVLQGRGVGGSTLHNTNLCKRTPDAILDRWRDECGVVDASPARMASYFERVERDLSVSEIRPSLRNANNEVLRRGSERLGYRHGPLRHNRVGCQQSGFRELRCVYDAKQSAAKVLVPQALSAGARVVSDARVLRVTHHAGRATGVEGVLLSAEGRPHRPIEVRAKVVVLAASAVGSAALALRSGLPDPHGQLGEGLRLHPGAAVAGVFDEPIHAHHGIPQSHECTEFLRFERGAEARVWIVPAFAHPIGFASTLPGFGAEHRRAMASYTHLAVVSAMVHDESFGRVRLRRDGSPRIHYELNEPDRVQLRAGLDACVRILFAAGAREVRIPAVPAVVLRSVRELDALDRSFVRPHGLPLTAVHPMGTLRMGEDPAVSAARSTGALHGLRGVFVADGSLFPTSLGVPPQISIYAFASKVAGHVLDAVRSSA